MSRWVCNGFAQNPRPTFPSAQGPCSQKPSSARPSPPLVPTPPVQLVCCIPILCSVLAVTEKTPFYWKRRVSSEVLQYRITALAFYFFAISVPSLQWTSMLKAGFGMCDLLRSAILSMFSASQTTKIVKILNQSGRKQRDTDLRSRKETNKQKTPCNTTLLP